MAENPKTLGFSLIELMVVISIVSVLTAISIPKYVVMKIRSAQVEMYQNTRHMATLATTYHADNGQYPVGFIYGFYSGFSGAPDTLICIANELGFATTNCPTMRYYYAFSGTGGGGQPNDATRRTRFTVVAYNGEAVAGGITYKYGSRGIPTNLCKTVFPFNSYYLDWWELYQDGQYNPQQNMVNRCL